MSGVDLVRRSRLWLLRFQSAQLGARLNGAIIVPIVADGDWP